jgi:Ca2+-binding RTX toxin-like protein
MVLTQGATIDFVVDSLGSQSYDALGLRALITEEHGVTINGTAGNDTINATTPLAGQPLPTNAADTINSGAGRDTIDALGGNDFINGGSGSDTMRGGAGNDTYVVDNTADVVIENPNEGTDTVQSSVNFSLSTNVEHLTLTGASNLNGTGNAFDNLISGNDGRNVLTGLAGADTLSGGAGRDTLIGGAEADTLTGGSGSDRFVYTAVSDSTVAEPDTIIDFIQGEDVIDFSLIDANPSRRGEQAFAFGGENPVANGVNWFESGGNTVVQADVTGDATADLQIILTGSHNLTATDFFF